MEARPNQMPGIAVFAAETLDFEPTKEELFAVWGVDRAKSWMARLERADDMGLALGDPEQNLVGRCMSAVALVVAVPELNPVAGQIFNVEADGKSVQMLISKAPVRLGRFWKLHFSQIQDVEGPKPAHSQQCLMNIHQGGQVMGRIAW